jgi:hypothetical protein
VFGTEGALKAAYRGGSSEVGGMGGGLLDFQVRFAKVHKSATVLMPRDGLDVPVKIARLNVTQSFWFTRRQHDNVGGDERIIFESNHITNADIVPGTFSECPSLRV